MRPSAVEQVVDFYHDLFEQLFSIPFRSQVSNPLERNAVTRLVGELADAASQSLTLFFDNRQLKQEEVAEILAGLAALGQLLNLDDIAQPGMPPETIIRKRLGALPYPEGFRQVGADVVYRLALQSVVENLLLIGPVLSKWQKFNFSRTYEPPRRIIERLNRNIVGLGAEQAAGQGTQDELYELDHRNYLLQRFERVEAGTVQITTNMVDLQALFVMPRVQPRPQRQRPEEGGVIDTTEIMNLAAARKFFGAAVEFGDAAKPMRKKDAGVPAFEQVKKRPRKVIVGAPGSGKSTFFEWLQLAVGGTRETLIAGEGQAIPLLLRVRELNAKKLPWGAGVIEAATGSEDRAALMPEGWLDRQMKNGRVIFMLDGLDETDPRTRDKYLLPWLRKLCEEYPDCRYLVSSRPAGYPPGTLRKLKFAECDLLDFNEAEITNYTRHWCTAIRLARSEPEDEARRRGAAEGEQIVKGFKSHPYIKNLARNPLMLSAICLANYFEDGRLPEDRARLYKLCVEGLLHHWDSRRGIHSDFSLGEKLRACRQVAIAMQADDRAEYEAAKVLKIFTKALDNRARAQELLEHIRYRTGLLIERRAGIFAFAHLTFQEYLAACAVHEGNYRDVDAAQLVREHTDGRWNEVIALYCGLAPTRDARRMLDQLVKQEDTIKLAGVLAEAYLSSGAEIRQDQKLRRRVIERIAIAPSSFPNQLDRFPEQDIALTINSCIGKIRSVNSVSQSHFWLYDHQNYIDEATLAKRLTIWREMIPTQNTELIHLLHAFGSTDILEKISISTELYNAPGPILVSASAKYCSLAEIALIGLSDRKINTPKHVFCKVFLQILRSLVASEFIGMYAYLVIPRFGDDIVKAASTEKDEVRKEFALLIRQLAARLTKESSPSAKKPVAVLNSWAESLEKTFIDGAEQQSLTEGKSKKVTKRAAKKTPKQR